MTDRVCAIALRERAFRWWWIALHPVPSLLIGVLVAVDPLAVLRRHRHLGHRLAGGLGFRDHQLRLVDRDRIGRHIHLRAVLLVRVEWRTSINRIAESMTLFAAACAGIYPDPASGPAVVLLLAVSLSRTR